MEAVIALAPWPRLTAAQHAEKVREIMGKSGATYSARQSSAYDLKKLRGKDLVQKISPRGRYYEAHTQRGSAPWPPWSCSATR